MSHLAAEIASLEARLNRLRADAAAEDAALDLASRTRPAGIPTVWKPVIFETPDGVARFDIVGWVAPGYSVRVLKNVDFTPAAPNPPGGQP